MQHNQRAESDTVTLFKLSVETGSLPEKPAKKRTKLSRWALVALAYIVLGAVLTHIRIPLFLQEFMENYDKWVHGFFYGGMALVVLLFAKQRIHHWLPRCLITLAAVFTFAAIDEAFQTISPGRFASLDDWFASAIGATIAVALAQLGWSGQAVFSPDVQQTNADSEDRL